MFRFGREEWRLMAVFKRCAHRKTFMDIFDGMILLVFPFCSQGEAHIFFVFNAVLCFIFNAEREMFE